MPDDSHRRSKTREIDQIDLSAFGYVERRKAPRPGTPDTIGYDGLGRNAALADNSQDSRDSSDYLRRRALRIDHLGLVDDEPPPDLKIISVNKQGLRVGYNPYDSGRLQKKEWKKPRDLRALSKWIESQRQAAEVRRDQEDENR